MNKNINFIFFFIIGLAFAKECHDDKWDEKKHLLPDNFKIQGFASVTIPVD